MTHCFAYADSNYGNAHVVFYMMYIFMSHCIQNAKVQTVHLETLCILDYAFPVQSWIASVIYSDAEVIFSMALHC